MSKLEQAVINAAMAWAAAYKARWDGMQGKSEDQTLASRPTRRWPSSRPSRSYRLTG